MRGAMGQTLEVATGIRNFGGGEGGGCRAGWEVGWKGWWCVVSWVCQRWQVSVNNSVYFILFYFIFCPEINTLTLFNKVGASGIKFQPAFCH